MKIFLITCFSVLLLSSGAVASETINVTDRPQYDDDYTDFQEAINEVENNGEIIIKEPQRFNDNDFYDGVKIGKEHEDIDDAKSITIRGEGIVPIKSKDGQDSAIEVIDNENKEIKIENILFVDSKHAIEAKSGSNIIVENIAIDSTIEDTPLILNEYIQSSRVSGAMIQDKGIYYPDDESNVIDAVNGDLDRESIGAEPTGLIYDKQEERLDYNPVTASNYEKPIYVGSNNEELEQEDDNNIQTPFYSLQAAVNAAASNSIITVYDREDDPYDTINFNGVGKSGTNDITIRGDDDESPVPTVAGFRGSYPGDYNIRNLQIQNDVIIDEDGVDLDISKNYLHDDLDTRITTGTSANIVEEPFCIDENCESYTFFDELNQCISITAEHSGPNSESEESCDEDEDISIDIGEFEDLTQSDSDIADFREIDINIDSNQDVDVEIDILSSDNSIDGEFTVSAGEPKSETIESQFSTIINQIEEDNIRIQPRARITINNNHEFTIKLSELNLEKPDEDDDFVDPDNIGQNQGSIQKDDFTGLSRKETTFVSRFNADNEGDVEFQDNIIPPTRTTSGDERDGARGTVRFFEELRTNPDRAAIVRPENPLRVGMSVQGISEARGHQLNITYAVQGKSGNNIDVNLVDENSRDIYTNRNTQLDVTSTDTENPFEDSGDTEGLETKTEEIPLHSSEVDFVNENGELYIVFENMDIDEDTVLLLYNIEVMSSDQENEIGEPDDDSESVQSNPDERPGGFTVSFDVDGNKNTDYGTYDVEPDEDLHSTIILENTGDTTINGTFAVLDDYRTPEIRYPNEDRIDDIHFKREELKRFTAQIAAGEVETIPINKSWNESEFGNHTVKLYEVTEDEDTGDERYRNIDVDEERTPQFDTYVFQKTTLDVIDIDVPEEHLTYDNFNAEVTVQNIGDLSGERTIESMFGQWRSEKDITIGGGDARANEPSEETVIRFAREVHPDAGEEYEFITDAEDGDYDFTFREYTTPDDVMEYIHDSVSGSFETSRVRYSGEIDDSYYRPNAPFGVEEGENTFRVDISNEMDGEIFSDMDSALGSTDRRTVELKNLVINDLNIITEDGEVTKRPTEEEGTIYASAYPYVQPSYGTQGSITRGETYVEGSNVRGGFGTMYSYNENVRDSEINRGATPLNLAGIDSVTQPHNRYFSIYYSHQNRVCNEELLGGEESPHIPEDDVSESSAQNVFLPFSANAEYESNLCGDRDRYVSLQLPRFADTTYDNTESNITVNHPQDEFEVSGVNQEEFWDLEENDSIMYAKATVSNPNQGQPATARFEIRTNRSTNADGYAVGLGESGNHQEIDFDINSFDDNVLGVASVELRPDETQEVSVPIVIKNDDGNDGVHVLSIHPRSENDYIRRSNSDTSPQDMPKSELTDDHHSQFQVPINVKTYGDAIIEYTEPVDERQDDGDSELYDESRFADVTVNNICTSNEELSIDDRDNPEIISNLISPDAEEGLNPKSGVPDTYGIVRDVGTCNNDEITDENVAEFETQYTNYGGENVTIRPETITEFESQGFMTRLHRESAQMTGDRFITDYDDNDVGGTDAEINAMYNANGEEIDFTDSVEIEPGESVTFRFSRVFQEPGLYYIRNSPCRIITDEGPQHYNLEGFSGIPDSKESPIRIGDRNTWTINHDRISDGNDNIFTTSEFSDSVFHGAKGCEDSTSSVFVYDTTEPVADFRLAESDSAVKNINENNYNPETILEDQTPDNTLSGDEEYPDEDKDEIFEVYEGGLLFFDGSTQDCQNCYDSDVFSPDTQADVSRFWTFRSELEEHNIKENRMSQTNTIITDMLWRINDEEPNYGDENVCTHVNQDDVDEHCYMEVLEGEEDFEVTAHRFNNPGEDTISLQVWDDTRFTEGESNTNETSQTVKVHEDTEPPIVNIDYSTHNDLSYAEDENLNHAEPVWHRNEDVVEYADLDNMQDKYKNVYEGIRTCIRVTDSYDEQIGVSQDAWYNLDDSTLITHINDYYDNSHGGDVDAGEVDVSESRSGDRRCIVFEEEDRFGNNDRTQTFEYEAWDFADNSNTSSVEIDVVSDDSEPSIDTFKHSYGGHFDHNEKDDYVWAANDETGYDGSIVEFEGSASDDGIGLACVDLRAEPAKNNCNSIADNANVDFEYDYTSRQLDYYNDTSEIEKLIVTDWHSNTEEDTTSINVKVDEDDPIYECDEEEPEDDDCFAEEIDMEDWEDDDTFSNSAEATQCVTFEHNGRHDGGVGLYDYELNGDASNTSVNMGTQEAEFCITAESDPDPEASASTPSSCGESNTVYEYESKDIENEVDITVIDYHNNDKEATIEARAKANARDSDTARSESCDDDDE